MGKAGGAAQRIFEIIDYPTSISAIAIDEEEEFKDKKKILNIEEIQGKVEFRNVWFRYPTRKEDFVLQGLSIVINPNEQVALVGESGCGKSTFVNLLMRFYDVDDG
jgi:ATP-binding cassette subfamily B protein